MMRSRVTDILGIRYPIVEGGMSIAGNGLLAAAVSNGGGLGVISSNPGWSPVASLIDNVRQHIHEARNNTKLPIGANVPLFHVGDYAERHIEMLIEESVEVVVTSGGSPKKLTPRLKAAGVTVMHVVGNAKQAKAAEDAGVDIVVCEGYEAGGIESPDELTTFVMTPIVADAVRLPVIAAGGIADGRGLLAALALGAEGVQVGSAFLATTECHVHPKFKQALVDSQDVATLMTTRSLGRLSRVLKTDLTMKMVELERRGAIDELKALMQSVPSRVEQIAGAQSIGSHYRGQMEGDLETGEGAAGQAVALVREVKSAAEFIADMVAEADAGLSALQSLKLRDAVR